jgi:dihydroorotate dehydrogenase electron transfer subunit
MKGFMDYLDTTVTEITRPAPGYALVRFRCVRPLEARPGQFVMVRGDWGAHPILPRAFSLVEAGEAGAVLVREVGDGTRRLAAMRPGDALSVLGPRGHGYSEIARERTPVLVAGGVGAAPLVFLAERLRAAGRRPIALFGARTRNDLPLADRLAAAGDLRIATEDGSLGERGLVTALLEPLLEKGRAAEIEICACGPERMLEAVAKLAVAAGARCQVTLESPMACGMGTCKGCAVLAASGGYKYVCSDGPVFDAGEIYGGGAR